MRTRSYGRRALLRGLGGTIVGLPFLDHFAPREAHAAELPKRILFLTTPNGTDPNAHWPTGGETDYTLSSILSPLEPYRDRLLVLRGVDNLAAQNTGINGHTDTVRCMLTGRVASNFTNDDYTAGGGISVDQFIANDIGATTAFKSLEYVTSYIYEHAANYVSFYGPSQPVPFEDEPTKLWDRVFADFDVPADDPALLEKKANRKSVLHAVYDEYSALNPKLGVADRMRLEAHLDKVKDLEARLDDAAGLSCEAPPQPPAEVDPELGLDVLVHALACDLTRVATVRLDFWDSYDFLGITGSYHDDYLHFVTQDPAKAAVVQQVKNYQCDQVRQIIDRLVAIPEGTGTLFDNTLVEWCDEFCHGYAHGHNEVPYVLASGSDRFFEMGRYLQHPNGVSNNRLWNALIGAMDAGGAGTFGDPVFDNTPLAL
jgi:hypothetical protein